MSADHAAEAQAILDDINNAGPDDNLPMDWAGATADEQWLVNASHAQAQVHATLALVEQQRIANIVSYLAIVETRGGYDRATLALEDDVREGLGL